MKYFLLSLFAVFVLTLTTANATSQTSSVEVQQEEYVSKTMSELFYSFYRSTGINAFLNPTEGLIKEGKEVSTFSQTMGRIIMIFIAFLLFYLAIAKKFEPLLLIPIGFGGLLANIPIADIAGPNGFLGIIYSMGIENSLFPILIFMGVGAMTDFGPLLANPKLAILGGAAQFGIFATIIGALALTQYTSFFNFSLQDAAAIGIIGGADGPTAIFIASQLAPELLGAIAIAAYSYMALVPIIQPPIMRALTTKKERQIKMIQLKEVSRLQKIVFPITIIVLTLLIIPYATPLIGALAFGNLIKESGVAKRLSDTLQNSLINIVTILLGLAIGSKLAAETFLVSQTLGIIVLGLIAFSIGTAAGVLMAKIMNKFVKIKINPLIGAAGVSAVPMSARVVNKEGMKEDSSNMLLMHVLWVQMLLVSLVLLLRQVFCYLYLYKIKEIKVCLKSTD